MPSPFPGMDPYLWPDLDLNMLSAFRGALNGRLPSGFVATTEQYVWIHQPGRDARRAGQPDIAVSAPVPSEEVGTGVSAAHVAAPTTRALANPRRRTRRYLAIREKEPQRIVTVLELLSPSNKTQGADRTAYLNKRSENIAAGVNVAEIDLLHGGRRVLLGRGPLPPFDYYAAVYRSWNPTEVGFWTFTVRDPLPEVPIPLREDVPDVLLPLRASLDRVYDEGRYAQMGLHARPLTPPLTPEDADWARQVLRR